METFRSKVDGWFIVAAIVVLGVGVAGAMGAAAAGTFLLPALVTLPAIALVIWVWRSTRYIVTDASLRVRCAWVDITVPVADITRLRRTSTALSAPALSLDRIEVQHAGGAVVISPAEDERFIAAITTRNPRVGVDGAASAFADVAQHRRHARTLVLALSGVLLVVAGLAIALNVYTLPPPRVTLTATGITVESGPARMAVAPGEITSLTLEEALPPVSKRLGWGTYSTLRGRFSTEEAAGWIHVARRRPPFIVLRTADSFLILNDSDPGKTTATYDAILQRWPALRH